MHYFFKARLLLKFHYRGNLIGLRPDPFASAPPVLYHFRLGHGLSSELPALSSVVCHRAPGMHHLSSLIRHLPPPLSHLSSFIGHPSRFSPPLACHEDRGPGGLRPEDRGSFPNECDGASPRFALLGSVGLPPGQSPLIRQGFASIRCRLGHLSCRISD